MGPCLLVAKSSTFLRVVSLSLIVLLYLPLLPLSSPYTCPLSSLFFSTYSRPSTNPSPFCLSSFAFAAVVLFVSLLVLFGPPVSLCCFSSRFVQSFFISVYISLFRSLNRLIESGGQRKRESEGRRVDLSFLSSVSFHRLGHLRFAA